jgi:hypothetical protein
LQDANRIYDSGVSISDIQWEMLKGVSPREKNDVLFVNHLLLIIYGRETLKISSLSGGKCRSKDSVPAKKLNVFKLNVLKGEFN